MRRIGLGAQFSVNMFLEGTWGIFGDSWGPSQVVLAAASFCQEVPQLHLTPLHNSLCTQPKHRICSTHIGICFNLCPAVYGSHRSTGLFSVFAAFEHLSLPISGQRQAEAASAPRRSTLPTAQATSFGAQLPGPQHLRTGCFPVPQL